MKILFFAHDAGGANAVKPIIEQFNNVEVFIFAKGPALNILQGSVCLPDDALRIYKPDFIITGTSGYDFTERLLWVGAKLLSIPCMAILDMWVNYGVRFSKYSTSELHLFNGKCIYFPDFLCVMDEMAKKDAIRDGVLESIILPFGNPHFETISAQKLDKAPSPNNKKIILFASQVFGDIWRKDSELIVLRDLIKIIKRETNRNLSICIRKHPLESEHKYDRYINERIFIDKNKDSIESIQMSDIIISINSMLLLDGAFLGKKIISYQPKSKDGMNDFILTRNGVIPYITNDTKFSDYFNELITKDDYTVNVNIPHKGIIEHITNFIKEQVGCHN